MEWWKQKNGILQIYPRSYRDTSGSGVGDLRGIIEKLSYIKGEPDSLGIDAIWLSPFYPSPMADFGYDVADYCDVDPLFGTLEDFKELVDKAHQRGIAVMIDLVMNHTSDQHPWFQEALRDSSSPKRDYYIFRNSKGDAPPNNWLSVFGGSAWQRDERSGQYYLHSFLSQQPDLNWQNPAVQDEFRQIVRFWCDLGVDGFRADAVKWMGKQPDLPDEPSNPDFSPDHDPYNQLSHIYSQSSPELEGYLKVITDEVKKYPNKLVIWEAYSDEEGLKRLYSIDPTVAVPFNFGGIDAWRSGERLAEAVAAGDRACPDGSLLVSCFGNHDKPRLVSRVSKEASRTIAILQMTLPGVPVIYYGEEIGMENAILPSEYIQDPFEKQVPDKGLGRDMVRTPMQWNDARNAGFSEADRTWLPAHENYREVNVSTQQSQPESHLQLYRRLLSLRRAYDELRIGSYRFSFVNNGLYTFVMSGSRHEIVVVANFNEDTQPVNLPAGGMVLCSALDVVPRSIDTVDIKDISAFEALVVEYPKRIG